MNVIDIVAEYLMANKHDGLCLPEHGCACLLGDLAPCGEMSEKCRPGYRENVDKHTPCFCDESGADHWHIVADDASGSDESGADSFTPLRRTAGNLRICAAVLPNYAASTAAVMIGFASEIEAWVKDHERWLCRLVVLSNVALSGPEQRGETTGAEERQMKAYQQRVVEENEALDEKIEKLDAFVETECFCALPEAEQVRMMRQLEVMREYSQILDERIAAF